LTGKRFTAGGAREVPDHDESRESANAIATIAGYSGGSRILLIGARGGAPRSMAASSYSLPIDYIRARTMITGHDTWQVTSPTIFAHARAG
jgi:hypothetical protein